MRAHLGVEAREYDIEIRRFVPGYDAMLATVADAVAGVRPALVLDLGAGTGALSGAILARDEVGAVELLDVDPEMLERARERLAPHGARARYRLGSFDDALPPCDAAAASLSLHHVPALEAKTALYRRIFRSLRPGGVFANGDATMPADAAGRAATYRAWKAHMARSGIGEDEVRDHLERWAEEDTYFPVENELEALAAAGFRARLVWNEGPSTTIAAYRDG